MDQARDLGADHVINHYQQKIAEEVRTFTGKAMCDIVFEHVGKATWSESVKSLKPGGSLVTCGATTGRKRTSICGSCLRGSFRCWIVHGHHGRLPRGDETYFFGQAEAGGR